jgi:hypothetical protein
MSRYHGEHQHVVRGCEYECRRVRLTHDQNIETALQEEEFGKFKLTPVIAEKVILRVIYKQHLPHRGEIMTNRICTMGF